MDKVREYLSRKFLLSVASLGGTFALVWYDKDVMGWATAMGVVLAFYNGSNVAQDYIASKKENKTTQQGD